jgi:signal transduction histidine kinase/chemotaxis response regulator CheB
MRLELLPDGSCTLEPFDHTVVERPLDVLLSSVAGSFGARAVAVVLTGMGKDGSAGARAVHAAGGTVLVQDEETADEPAMPRAAAETGAADRILPLHEIGWTIAHLVSGSGLPPAREDVVAAHSLFAGDGEVARLAREMDWGATALGPVSRWPDTLWATVRVALATPLATCVLWGSNQIQLYNDAYRHIMGAKHPAGLGQANRDCWPEVRHLNEPIYARVLAGEAVELREALYPITRNDVLEDAWFDLIFSPVHERSGTVGGVLCTVVDKTAEVLGARRLRTLHELTDRTAGATTWQSALTGALAVLAESADLAFTVGYRVDRFDAPARLVDAVGVERDGPMAPSRIPLATGSPSWPLRRAALDGAPVLLDDVAERFGGAAAGPVGLACRQALLVPLLDPGTDTTTGFVVLGISPRLPLDALYQEFLRLAGREIAARVGEAHSRERERERLDRFAELDRAKTEFFSNVSHEFRTPLTLMLGPLEQLQVRQDEFPEQLRGDIDLAVRNTRRLLRLVGSLLDFSQAEAGRLRTNFEPTDLATLTVEITSMFRSAAERAGLKLQIDAPPLSQLVWVDPQMWEKILSNLLANALKFTFSGTIEVAVRTLPQHAEIEVRDTGVGIPPDELPHLFKRFHRVSGTKARTQEGAGIGLALAYELVRRHQGRIRVRSTEGQGTTFTVWLPLGPRPETGASPARPDKIGEVAAGMADEAARWNTTREAAVASLQFDEEPVSDERFTRRAVGARVLVADDNADMRDYLVRLLGGTWTVTQAGDGDQALRMTRHDRPDLVVADVMMPGLDGFALVRAIRADPGLAPTPIVLVTARAGEESAVEGLLAGADDYIVKPFSARELLARVGAQIELARLRRHSEQRFRALINASWDVVYRMSPDWTEMRNLDGRGFIADTESPDTSWLDRYIHPDDQPEVTEAIQKAIRDKTNFELQHRVRRPDGTLGWTLSRAVPLLDDDGQIIEWVGAASDLSTRPAPPNSNGA